MKPTFQIQCTRKSTGEVYFAYNGITFTKEKADKEAEDCTKFWGDKIEYKVVPYEEKK